MGSTAGTDGSVRAIASSGDTALYVGGVFSNAGGSAISRIAKYSIAGDKWSALGGGVSGAVYSVAVQKDSVIIGGAFATAGLFTVNRIAVWKISTSTWSGFGSGTDGNVLAVLPITNDNFAVGGNFSLAGNRPSYGFARYNPYNPTGVVQNKLTQPNTFELSQNYPNPFNPATTINYQLPNASRVTVSIYNLLGQLVTTLVNNEQSAGSHSVQWNGKDSYNKTVSSGVYLYKIIAQSQGKNMFIDTKKMMLLK